MWRILHAFAIAALIGSAAYVYGVKYRTIYASEQLVKTRHLIAREKDAINLLRAEYAHLARPDRPAKKSLTMRSSSEWNVTTARRPPGLRRRSAAQSPRTSSASSSLTAMRKA